MRVACAYSPRLHARNVHLQSKPLSRTEQCINAFVTVRAENSSNEQQSHKTLPGPLSGLSIAVKDNICTSTLGTTCSSIMLQEFQPEYNATVVDLIEQAGGYILGKTNCDEFGMGSANVHTIHGPVINPFQPNSDPSDWSRREKRSAGGSSGGSAAAVASDQCFAALSTDTGGSTRLPASYCGVVGLKPSYGLLSRWGIISFADSLDTVGIMASHVRDVRRIFDVVSRFDERDPTSVPLDFRLKAATACQRQIEASIHDRFSSLQGLRVGIPQEYFPAELDLSLIEPCRRILTHFRNLGATLIPVSLPTTKYGLSAYYVLASAEASSNMARYDGVRYGTYVPLPEGHDKTRTASVYSYSRSRGFGREVQKRILLGTYALTADAFDNYFLQAQRLRLLIRQDFDRVFREANVLSDAHSNNASNSAAVDVLIHPSAIRTAPPLLEAIAQGLDTYVQDALTVPASLAGLPALSVPAGHGKDGWPIGLSIVGQWGCDEMVLRVGEVVEKNICAA